jgi:predicted DNA-binding transcriptional regulator AlpA
MEQLYLTSKEVADLIGLQVGTIYWRRQKGNFPRARKVGKNLLYSKDEVIKWIEGTIEPIKDFSRRKTNKKEE